MPKDEAQLYAANELYAFTPLYPFCLVLFLDDLVLVLDYFRIITFTCFLATTFSIWQY